MPALAEPPQQQAPPTPAPEPTPEPQPTSIESFDDQFKELDSTPDPEPQQIAPADQPPVKPDAPAPDPKQPDKGQQPPKDAPKDEPESYDPPQAAKPNELRGWALRMGKKAKDVTERLVEVQKKLDEALKRPAPQPGPDPVVTRQLTEAQKRIEDYEQKMRMVRYEQSAEYNEKYEKPIRLAESKAKRDIESLEVSIKQKEKNPETGEEVERVVQTRPGTWNDFAAIYGMRRPEAKRTAKAMFGEDADQVMKHYDEVHDRYESAHLATEEYRTKGKELEAQTEAEKKREQDFMAQGWEKANTAFIAKSPQDFDERDGDVEGNDLLNKARNFVDLFMSDEREKYPLPQRLLADARVRNWASAYPRAQRDVKKLRAEVTELTKQIEALRGSAPGKPATGDGQAPVPAEDWKSAFDRMV